VSAVARDQLLLLLEDLLDELLVLAAQLVCVPRELDLQGFNCRNGIV
jgi:hypothetical protein